MPLPPRHAMNTEWYLVKRRTSAFSILANYLGPALLKIRPTYLCEIEQVRRIRHLTAFEAVSEICTNSLNPAVRVSAKKS